MREYIFYLFDDVPLECEDSSGRFEIKAGRVMGIDEIKDVVSKLMEFGFSLKDPPKYVVLGIWKNGE